MAGTRLEVVERVKYATLLKGAKDQLFVKLDECRASYPYLGEASKDKNDDGTETERYRVTFQLPKTTHDDAYKLLRRVIEKMQTDNKAEVETAHWFLKNGDRSENESDHGFWLVNAAEHKNRQGIRPTVRNAKTDIVTDDEAIDKLIYGGCWINGTIRPWYFNGQSKRSQKKLVKRLSCGLESVQFFRDDTPYGRQRIDDSDLYSSVAGSEGSGMDDDDI